jgi:hypothetical protein
MTIDKTILPTSFRSVDPIARARPSVGLALGWVAYGLLYATVAGCFIGPVLLALSVFGLQPG